MDAKVRPCLRAVIQPQHRLHHPGQRCRQVNHALTHAILRPVDHLLLQRYAEGFLDIRGRARQLHRAAQRRRRIRLHPQVELARKGLHLLDRLRIASVALLKLGSAYAHRAVRPSAAPVEFNGSLRFTITDTVTMDFAGVALK